VFYQFAGKQEYVLPDYGPVVAFTFIPVSNTIDEAHKDWERLLEELFALEPTLPGLAVQSVSYQTKLIVISIRRPFLEQAKKGLQRLIDMTDNLLAQALNRVLDLP
jgi:hypothetical protein